jgi:hypothetical protein
MLTDCKAQLGRTVGILQQLSHCQIPAIQSIFEIRGTNRTAQELCAISGRIDWALSQLSPSNAAPAEAPTSAPEPKASKAEVPSKAEVAGALSAVKKMVQ